jgi:hypothetical protein
MQNKVIFKIMDNTKLTLEQQFAVYSLRQLLDSANKDFVVDYAVKVFEDFLSYQNAVKRLSQTEAFNFLGNINENENFHDGGIIK